MPLQPLNWLHRISLVSEEASLDAMLSTEAKTYMTMPYTTGDVGLFPINKKIFGEIYTGGDGNAHIAKQASIKVLSVSWGGTLS
jgi:hypothetical protein